MKSTAERALFLDRDGVINVDTGYVHDPAHFHFIGGIFELCRSAQAKGYRIVVVSNQAGLARGFFTEDDVRRLHDWMTEEFRKNGVTIDGIYYCPFHPAGVVPQFTGHSEFRKPNPGMIQKAASEMNIVLEFSALVGDKESDIEAGQRAGLKLLYLFDSSSPYPLRRSSCGFVANSLQAVAESLP